MVHTAFDTREVSYDDFHIQYGGGGDPASGLIGEPYHYFKGTSPYYHRGYGRQSGGGIGDILSGVWRVLLPLVRKAGGTLGKEALETGGRILDKITEGGDVKSSVIEEGKKGVDNLLVKSGLEKQFGGGAKRKKRRKSPPLPNHQTLIGRPVIKPIIPSAPKKKRIRKDTFGLY